MRTHWIAIIKWNDGTVLKTEPFYEYDEGIKVWSSKFSYENKGKFEWIGYEKTEEPKQVTLEEVKPPIGKFIIDNAVSTQGNNGAYYHYSEVCKLLRLQQEQDKNKYSEEEVMNILKERDLHNSINMGGNNTWIDRPEWFEQFKKK